MEHSEPLERPSGEPLTAKARRTREAILAAALDLMQEVGFERTTMRAIAERAQVSVGNAYYYFSSKEALVQAFYARTHEEHLVVARPRIAAARGLGARLRATMSAKLETIEAYHPFAGVLFRTAADPRSPLNPFSAESAPVREEAIQLFREVALGSGLRLPKDLAAELPRLLWTWHMGVILYWVHDDSAGRRKSWRLMEQSSALIASSVRLSSLRVLAPLRRKALKLVRELEEVT